MVGSDSPQLRATLAIQPLPEATLRVRDVGEFGLLERLQARVQARGRSKGAACQPAGLSLGIGDDAAVWQPSDHAHQVITTDALVQDVHFRFSTTSWRDLGWKSAAVNVSDLAAMGCHPRSLLVTLGLPAETLVADLLELYDGMLDLAERYVLDIVGGDIVSAPVFFLSVTAIGEAVGPLLRRDAGRPGDVLATTGSLGASAAGLRLLESGRKLGQGRDDLLLAHLRPRPRVAEGLALVEAGLRCGMDVSDGLLGDTTHVCERSGVSAVIETERVPLSPALREEFGDAALPLAIAGGEDYELLCAGSAEVIERARRALAALGTPLTVVGQLRERSPEAPLVQLVDARGRTIEPGQLSWDHFRG